MTFQVKMFIECLLRFMAFLPFSALDAFLALLLAMQLSRVHKPLAELSLRDNCVSRTVAFVTPKKTLYGRFIRRLKGKTPTGVSLASSAALRRCRLYFNRFALAIPSTHIAHGLSEILYLCKKPSTTLVAISAMDVLTAE